MVCNGKQPLNRRSVLRIDGDTDADGDDRLLAIIIHALADASRGLQCFVFAGFRKNQREFIAAVAGCRIRRAAIISKHVSDALNGAASDEMPETVVDLFQSIQIEQQNGKTAAGAPGTLQFGIEYFNESPVIRKSGKRIAFCETAHFIEQVRILEQRPAKDDRVTRHQQEMRQNVRRIERLLRLARGQGGTPR